EFRKSFNCTCGHKTSMKLSKTEGVSTKISAMIETSVEGALGAAGLAQLKSSIKATLGAEVNWSESRTEELNFECDPPKCGSCDDRKSTRLNSSHLGISYAVFCLKKKKKNNHETTRHSTEI